MPWSCHHEIGWIISSSAAWSDIVTMRCDVRKSQASRGAEKPAAAHVKWNRSRIKFVHFWEFAIIWRKTVITTSKCLLFPRSVFRSGLRLCWPFGRTLHPSFCSTMIRSCHFFLIPMPPLPHVKVMEVIHCHQLLNSVWLLVKTQSLVASPTPREHWLTFVKSESCCSLDHMERRDTWPTD